MTWENVFLIFSSLLFKTHLSLSWQSLYHPYFLFDVFCLHNWWQFSFEEILHIKKLTKESNLPPLGYCYTALNIFHATFLKTAISQINFHETFISNLVTHHWCNTHCVTSRYMCCTKCNHWSNLSCNSGTSNEGKHLFVQSLG